MTSTSLSHESERFQYEELFAYFRGELHSPRKRAQIASRIETEPRWKAHWDSLRFFDLEQAAAIQDGKALRDCLHREPTALCRAVADTSGKVFLRHAAGRRQHPIDRWTQEDWDRHVDLCVYCRRMMRRAYAAEERRAAGLPADEPLARDWLLRTYFAAELKKVTCEYKGAPVPDVPDAQAPRTDFLTVFMKGTTFEGVGNGHLVSFRSQHEGKFDRWGCRSWQRERRYHGPGVLRGADEGLEFDGNLGRDIGILTVRVFLGTTRIFTCRAHLRRPSRRSESLRELTLRLVYLGAVVAESHGTDRHLRVAGQLGSDIAENSVSVSVLGGAGGDARLLAEISLKFQEGEPEPRSDAP